MGDCFAKPRGASTQLKPDMELAGFQSGQFESLLGSGARKAVRRKRASASRHCGGVCRALSSGSRGRSRAFGSGIEVSRSSRKPVVRCPRPQRSPEYRSRGLHSGNRSIVQDASSAELGKRFRTRSTPTKSSSTGTRRGWGRKDGDLGRRMKDRFERLERSVFRPGRRPWRRRWISLAAGRGLSVSGLRARRSRRENATRPGIQATRQSETPRAAPHRTMSADRPVDAAGAIGDGPDGLASEVDEARAAVTRTTITRSRGQDESGRLLSEGRSSRSR